MLLLVLILVLVAFGLLVVALLTGNVLCAWLSVAVSVAAAVVLVVDWRQRRSAERAGRAGTDAVPPRADVPGRDHDPVTEVLPIVAPGASTTGSDASSGAQTMSVDTRFKGADDVQRTVTIPARQPSGSTDRPSGAEAFSTPSEGSSSPTVISAPVRSSVGDDAHRSADERRTDQRGDAESTLVVDVGKRPGEGAQSGEGAAVGGPRLEKRPTTATTDRPELGDPAGLADRATPPPATESTGSAGAPTQANAPADAEPDSVTTRTDRPGDRRAPDDDIETATTRTPRGQGGGEPGRPGSVTAADASADGAQATVVTRPAGAGGSTPDSALPPPQAAQARAGHPDSRDESRGRATFGGSAAMSGHELFDPVDPTSAAPPAATDSGADPAGATRGSSAPPSIDEEPPEEPHDPAVARIVSTLADQVLVVDEQPRYHVVDCRALIAQSTIPLPAREAVELGFTPCGWCTPDAVLGGQHRAGAH